MDVVSVGIELNGVARILELRLNSDLVAAGYQERLQHKKGHFKTQKPTKVVSISFINVWIMADLFLCVYQIICGYSWNLSKDC